MSITGAVALGAELGAGITNFILDYTKADYERCITNLEEQVNILNSHLTNLRSLQSSVPSFWDDEEGKKACKALELTISSVTAAMTRTNNLISIYKTAVAEFDNSKVSVNTLIEDALGILESVTDA